ncbi:MAG: hypothetical protein ACK4UJ_05540 [Leptonema sp. (in: bacteria)]
MKLKIFLLIFFIVFSCKKNKDPMTTLTISNNFFVYKNPDLNSIKTINFPMDLIYPNSSIKYFLYWERTGIWNPDQYSIMLEVNSIQAKEVWNYYNNILKIKKWQILQTKVIRNKNQNIYFIHALDFFNRSISVVIEEEKKLKIKMYLKKLTDE